MQDLDTVTRFLELHLRNPDSGFSIGSLGAIAEFHRAADEPLTVADSGRLSIATDRGAIALAMVPAILPLAYETLGGRADRWNHGIAFCLPASVASGTRRTTLTELGADEHAVLESDRDMTLFDMGLGAPNVDFCVRTRDATLIAALRGSGGKSILAPGNPVMETIIDAGPHRVAICPLGRIEVFPPIDRARTPDGPHTHLLPKLLQTGRTHSANIPVPAGYLPSLMVYPPNPLADGSNADKPFDRRQHEAFQAAVERWGEPHYRSEKARIAAALQAGAAADQIRPPTTRAGRLAFRIALRQHGVVGASRSR